MNYLLKRLNELNPKTSDEAVFIVREFLQEIVLIGLSRGGFFSKATFYGGTALRIFDNLNRYSEDLDFTLNEPDSNFDISKYKKSIIDVAASYEVDLDIDIKEKKNDSNIESAFAKLNTYLFFINVNFNSEISNRLHKDEKLKVKFEVDTSPALGFNIESKWIIEPEFASINVLDDASLFAGKIHAILCRTYKNNVKGRDYYDFMHFIRKGTKPNLVYLKNKLIQSGKIAIDDPFDIDDVKALLIKKIDIVNFDDIRKDAQRFLIENEDLSQYSKELFYDCIRRI